MHINTSLERSLHQRHRSRLVRGSIVLATAALIALVAGASPAAAQTSATKAASRPVKLSVLSPGRGDTAGKDGAGFVVDLALTARNKAANGILSAEEGYKPFFNNPTAPTFQPGRNDGAPGLVVMLSTTPTTPGTPFQGPRTNLAGLFQINGVGTVKGGLIQTRNTWQIGKAAFGSGPSTLTVFVVKGAAPSYMPDTGVELISNRVDVPFMISPPAATPGAPATVNPNATVKVTKDATLGDILVDANGRTLYLFEKDQGTTSACTGACAKTWPALKADSAPTAGAGLDASKIGSANGQVTYAGHLLYFYSGDGKPGDTIGASIPGWAAVSPAGTAIHAN
jgi:predicted lipoprotein with Yx(FWY)xxD motif